MSYNPWAASAPPQLATNNSSVVTPPVGMDPATYNWQQWQAYQQQYAQWNAQYGEQVSKIISRQCEYSINTENFQ